MLAATWKSLSGEIMKTDLAHADVYLNLLASRAVTGLMHLARNPQAWNSTIEADLEKGVEFCDALIQEDPPESIELENNERFGKILKRLTSEVSKGRPGLYVSYAEIQSNCEYLRRLVRRDVAPQRPEVTVTMSFFLKATSGQSTRVKGESDLF